ncbi:MAG: RidA family protein [bacterium]|nr:RidA family protein [bacterium]
MHKTAVSTDHAPTAVGPYSQAIIANGLVFVAGQIPLIPGTKDIVDGDISAQTARVLDNIRAILEAAGSDMAKVVKATVFLTDLADFAAMNAVYATYFTDVPPARSTVQVAGLPRAGVRVEIEVVALA